MKNFFLVLLSLIFLQSCYIVRAYRFRKFELDDLGKLRASSLPAAAAPFRIAYDTTRYPKLKRNLDSVLAASKTYGFLVIRRDSILYERYFGEVQESSLLPSFSIAKSVTGTLVGIALHEGKIKSLQEPVTNYLPELGKNDQGFKKVTIQHLLDMRSGVESSEDYSNPFSDVLRLGFAANVVRTALKTTIEKEPGTFSYKSVNTQLLAMIVEKATGKKLQEYASEKLWKPMQMENAATWNTDNRDKVRAFCCINATARDFAKLGRLYLKNGNWQGQQIVPATWIQQSTAADTMARYNGYRNQWWANTSYKNFSDSLAAVAFIPPSGVKSTIRRYTSKEGKPPVYTAYYWNGAFHAEGILSQVVYINPEKELIIVRLGYYWQHPQVDAVRFIYNLAAQF
ncbi:MAG TPA: serine hydrolase [Segetibacter sp.]|jgi:CubicO group peptidase (beta-lactamase class C family)